MHTVKYILNKPYSHDLKLNILYSLLFDGLRKNLHRGIFYIPYPAIPRDKESQT